jgi:hypothetical protein
MGLWFFHPLTHLVLRHLPRKVSPMTTTVRKSVQSYTDEQVNMKYLEMLPTITKSAKIAFAGYSPDRRDEAVQCVLVWAFMNLKHLAAKGRLDEVYASPVAKYAIGRHRSGRSLGVTTSSTDVMSFYCQSLGRAKTEYYGICENLEDTFVPNAANFRLDFEDWYYQQEPRDQQIIDDLAMGETLSAVARKHGLTPACIFQYRKRYANSWDKFIKEAA